MPELSGMIQEFLEGSIKSIGGKQPVIQSKTITKNGTYNAPSGVDGFNPVVVNVSSSEPVIEPKSIFANGEYSAPEGVDGYSPIIVDVPSKIEETLNVTSNGTYTPESGKVYNAVIVNVPEGVRVANQDETVELKVLPSGETYVYFNNFVLQNGISELEVLNLPILETILSNFRRDEAWTAQNYTHDGIQTDGHIGIYGNSLRGWTEDYASYSPATFNAVLHLTVEQGNQNIPYNSIH